MTYSSDTQLVTFVESSIFLYIDGVLSIAGAQCLWSVPVPNGGYYGLLVNHSQLHIKRNNAMTPSITVNDVICRIFLAARKDKLLCFWDVSQIRLLYYMGDTSYSPTVITLVL